MGTRLFKMAVAATVVAVACSVAGVSRAEAAGDQGTDQAAANTLQTASSGDLTSENTAANTQDPSQSAVPEAVAEQAQQDTAIVPIANPDLALTTQGHSVVIDVLRNDTGENLTLEQPSGASASLSDGKIIYTPAPDFSGTDYFDYSITDDLGNTSNATVSVTVIPVPAILSTSADRLMNIYLAALDTALDVVSETGAKVTEVSDAAHGAVFIGCPQTTADTCGGDIGPSLEVSYLPDQGFIGTDSFTYEITDDQGNVIPGTVNVTVVPAPVANPDTASTGEGRPTTVFVLDNDTGDGILVRMSDETRVAHGTLSYSRLGPSDPWAPLPACPDNVICESFGIVTVITYTPDPGFVGTDSFDYTIVDKYGNTSTSTVTVTVAAAPVANPDAVTVKQNQAVTIPVLDNDTGEKISISTEPVPTPAHGTVELNSPPCPEGSVCPSLGLFTSLTYTPDKGFTGTDSFQYTISDTYGNSSTTTVTVNVVKSFNADTGGTVVRPGVLASARVIWGTVVELLRY